MERAAIVTQRLRSYDGSELNCYRAGNPDGPTMVLCNGLGGNIVVWRGLIDHFAPRFQILSWDYRGLHRSGPATNADHYDMVHHVADLVYLLEHWGVDSPLLLGWSMGVQLSLELHRTHPDLARAIIAIHGTDGEPFKTAFNPRWTVPFSKLVFGAMRVLRRDFEPLGTYLVSTPQVVSAFVWTARRMRLMAPTLDVSAFQEVADEWVRMDLGIYADVFERASRHDARDLLPSIKTPTLIIAGDRDPLTPEHLSHRMASELVDATVHVVHGATHFGLIEFPQEIVRVIDTFLQNKLGLPGPDCGEGAP